MAAPVCAAAMLVAAAVMVTTLHSGLVLIGCRVISIAYMATPVARFVSLETFKCPLASLG